MTGAKPAFTNQKDKKISIYRQKDSKGPSGEPNGEWEAVYPNIWANYRSTSGKQFYAAYTNGYRADCCFTVNWHSDIGTGMCVLYRGKVYKIIYVDDMEGYKKDIKLHCETALDVAVDELL